MKYSKILFILFAGSALVFAEAANSSTAATASAPIAKHSAKAMLVIKGKVVSTDVIENKLIVKTKKAEDTLNVDSTTVIRANGKKIALGDLSSETPVSISYKNTDGKMIAVKITKIIAATQHKTVPKDSTKTQAK